MRIAVLLAAALLTGCATKETVWEHPEASQQRFDMDRGQCQSQAFSVPLASTMQQFMVYASCMRGKGWTPREKTSGQI